MAKCFFCNCPPLYSDNISHSLSYPFCCPYCGHYSIARDAKINCEKYPEFRAKAAAIAQEMYLSVARDGYELVFNQDIQSRRNTDTIFLENSPFLANYPKDYLETIDRVLINIGRKTSFSPLNEFRPSIFEFGLFFVNPKPTFYQEDHVDNLIQSNWKDIESKITATIDILKEHNYISVVYRDIEGWKFSCEPLKKGPTSISLTVDGLKRIRCLQEDRSQNAESFLAMWFSDKYSLETYKRSVDAAVAKAGYNTPCRVDKEKYNGNIIFEITNRIKKSRFLIADLTCEHENLNSTNYYCNGVRGGVYYEAGFAAGLGIPVILTCKESCKGKGLVHFDLNQFNMILWEEHNGEIYVAGKEEKLEDYLKEWIVATVGNGPNLSAT